MAIYRKYRKFPTLSVIPIYLHSIFKEDLEIKKEDIIFNIEEFSYKNVVKGKWKRIEIQVDNYDVISFYYSEKLKTIEAGIDEMKDLLVKMINERYNYEIYFAKKSIFFNWVLKDVKYYAKINKKRNY